jgi:hypothetical protein
MPGNKYPLTSVEPRPSEERLSDGLCDWLRQIDRWVNEGGADEKPSEYAGGTHSGKP